MLGIGHLTFGLPLCEIDKYGSRRVCCEHSAYPNSRKSFFENWKTAGKVGTVGKAEAKPQEHSRMSNQLTTNKAMQQQQTETVARNRNNNNSNNGGNKLQRFLTTPKRSIKFTFYSLKHTNYLVHKTKELQAIDPGVPRDRVREAGLVTVATPCGTVGVAQTALLQPNLPKFRIWKWFVRQSRRGCARVPGCRGAGVAVRATCCKTLLPNSTQLPATAPTTSTILATN